MCITNTYPLSNIYRVTSEKRRKRKQTYIRHEHRTCMFAESVLMLQLPELSHFLWFIVGILNNILIKGESFVCYASRTQN